MAYFRNSTVNLLNLHYGMHAAAVAGGGAFYLVYLLKAGLPPAGVLASIALILAGRFLIRPLIIPAAARWGLRALVFAGVLVSALQYFVLAEVQGLGPMLFALIALGAVGDTIYWSTYHAYFAALGDAEHRGHQLGAREAIGALVGVVSPLIAGWLLVSFGPRVAFGVTAAVAMLSALPLLGAPDVPVAKRVPGAFAASRLGFFLFMADGWTAAGAILVWQIALFQSLSENYMAYGGALALAAFAGAIGGLLLGRHIDAGHGGRAVWLAFGVFAFVIALRAAASGHPALAVIANALGAVANCLYIPTTMTAVYNAAKQSPCVLRFHVAAEGGWDIGGASGLLLAAALALLGFPLWAGVLLSLLGVAANFFLLRRYYAAAPRAAQAAA